MKGRTVEAGQRERRENGGVEGPTAQRRRAERPGGRRLVVHEGHSQAFGNHRNIDGSVVAFAPRGGDTDLSLAETLRLGLPASGAMQFVGRGRQGCEQHRPNVPAASEEVGTSC